MSYFFIINPAAGHRFRGIENLIRSIFQGRHSHFEIVSTRARGHALELSTRAVIEGYRNVVAVGGDGTIRETAMPLVGKEQVLGIIPCGSGNGLARNLHIPMKPAEVCRSLFDWPERRIDVALANGKPFFCTAGFGLDAEVAR
ncbi:MAG: diacylglycerol kinase family protein, partial [bacterium]